ncbi:hypothetical protein G3488_15470 [Shewanella baltica]|uniref:restriction endonuclease subunit S n=1 Tax=Shewanella baltica TaxID=62322 RepID=UPI00217E7C2C|nr:restriction endonuclease subunit S [Shewanella baltica]MCS6232251.1 hypothetical protein [Shewanella baltica]
MISKWGSVRVEDIAEVRSGKRLPKGQVLISEPTAHPYIRLVDVDNGRVQSSNLQYLSVETRASIKKYVVNTDDICLAIVGHTIGMVFYIEDQWDDVNLTENAARITNLSSSFNPRFIYYYLTSPIGQQEIISRKVGSAQGKLPLYNIKSLEIPNIPRIIQDKVVGILDSLSLKYELNAETNQTLEQTAQAIFKSWFVDFDPVKAKMNGKQPEGMDEATASLFPEKLVESELGLIPEGWELKTLKSLSEKISKGTTPSKMDLESATDEPFIRFIKVRDINEQGEILRSKLENIPDSIHTTKLKRSILKKEDILFSIAGTIGRVAIVDQDLDNVNTNQAVAFVRLKEKQTYLPLVYMALRENRLQQKAIASIVQGVQANLSLANVGDMEVIVPSEDILNLWNKQYSSILQMIKNNFAQSRELASLRDTLLPKLLSGEIDLAETTIK